MASYDPDSSDSLAPPSAAKLGLGGAHERSAGARLALDPRAGLAAAFKSAVAYFGRTEPASEQCEANR